MSDVLGHHGPFVVGTDIGAVHWLARYVHRLARVAVLRPTSAGFRVFRAVAGKSFECQIRLNPFDQTSQALPFCGPGPDGSPAHTQVGAALLELRFRPKRAPGAITDDAPESVITAEPKRAAEKPPPLTIRLRNRADAESLSPQRQKIQRRLLNLVELKKRPEPRFLSVRSIYVGDHSSDEDLQAQMSLALLQAGVVDSDSDLAEWWVCEYLPRFLRKRIQAGDRATVCGDAFLGLCTNCGNAGLAQQWRPYVKKWVRSTEKRVLSKLGNPHDRVEAEHDPTEPAHDRTEPAYDPGEPEHDRVGWKHDLDVLRADAQRVRPTTRSKRYATPHSGQSAERLSVQDLADRLGVSKRQVYRWIKKGHVRPVRQNPVLFDPTEADRWAGEWSDKRAAQMARQQQLKRLVAQAPRPLTTEAARKAEYRRRKRDDTPEPERG